MTTYKKFFIYFLLIIAFFIFSRILIYIALNTTYQYKNLDIKTSMPMDVEVKATSIDGFVKGKIFNNTGEKLENKYIKIDCYSKHDVLMGTKYIKIDNLEANEEKKFEVRFNFYKVDKATIDIIEEQAIENTESIKEQIQSDPQRGLAAIIVAIILLHFI